MFGWSPVAIIVLGMVIFLIISFRKKNKQNKNKITNTAFFSNAPDISKKTDREIITATKSFSLLIQASADIADTRQQAEKLGIIQKWMTHDQAIAYLLVLYVLEDYDYKYSPQIVLSLLKNYCRPEIVESFIDFYYKQTEVMGIKAIPLSQLYNGTVDARMDIEGSASQGLSVGWKISWCPFKEPYKSQWFDGFKNQ
jgi:hypothetical protein